MNADLVVMGEPADTPSNRNAGSYLLAAGLVAIVTLVVFAPALGNGFVNWDDGLYTGAKLDAVSLWTAFAKVHESGNWHPLALLSHKLDKVLWGNTPLGHHLTSILLHASNAGLLVLLAGALFAARARQAAPTVAPRRAPLAAAAAALLWALHPLRVESVAWVSERKDLLCGFFYLLGLLAYLGRAAHPARAWYASWRSWTVTFCFVAALMSKPMAVSFPLVLLILDGFPLARLGRATWPRALAAKVPFFCLSGAAAWITLHAQRQGGAYRALADVALSTRGLVAVRSTMAYLGETLWPSPLIPFNSYPREMTWVSGEFLLSAILLVALVALAVWALRRPSKLPKCFAAAFAAYLVLLLPVLGLVQVGPQAMADRYTYLPSIPLALLAAAAIAKALERAQTRQRQAVLALPWLLVAGTLSWLTVVQIAVWHDSESLWTHELRYEPQNMEAYNNRASDYYDRGLFQKALADYDAALATPAQVSAKHARKRRAACFNDRAITHTQLGSTQQALADESEAIHLMPNQASYYLNRAKMYQQLQMTDAAEANLAQAGRLREPAPKPQ